jgi:hypothetical protein
MNNFNIYISNFIMLRFIDICYLLYTNYGIYIYIFFLYVERDWFDVAMAVCIKYTTIYIFVTYTDCSLFVVVVFRRKIHLVNVVFLMMFVFHYLVPVMQNHGIHLIMVLYILLCYQLNMILIHLQHNGIFFKKIYHKWIGKYILGLLSMDTGKTNVLAFDHVLIIDCLHVLFV